MCTTPICKQQRIGVKGNPTLALSIHTRIASSQDWYHLHGYKK
jgi:hypothetical protein